MSHVFQDLAFYIALWFLKSILHEYIQNCCIEFINMKMAQITSICKLFYDNTHPLNVFLNTSVRVSLESRERIEVAELIRGVRISYI